MCRAQLGLDRLCVRGELSAQGTLGCLENDFWFVPCVSGQGAAQRLWPCEGVSSEIPNDGLCGFEPYVSSHGSTQGGDLW